MALSRLCPFYNILKFQFKFIGFIVRNSFSTFTLWIVCYVKVFLIPSWNIENWNLLVSQRPYPVLPQRPCHYFQENPDHILSLDYLKWSSNTHSDYLERFCGYNILQRCLDSSVLEFVVNARSTLPDYLLDIVMHWRPVIFSFDRFYRFSIPTCPSNLWNPEIIFSLLVYACHYK